MLNDMPRKKNWSHSVGPYGSRIRLSEDSRSGIIYAETRDTSLKSGIRSRSLRHRDRDRAIKWAQEQVLKLMAGDDSLRDPTPTLNRVLGFYLAQRTPRKCAAEQKADRRRSELWTRVLGPQKDLRRLTRHDWEQFIDLRTSGSIDCRGRAISPDRRRPVSVGTVGSDCTFLKSVLSWGLKWQDQSGRYLLRENPVRGFEIPVERNPRRPVVTVDRYQKVLAAAEGLKMRTRWSEKPVYVRSHLADILTLAHHTGRRISAIVELRFEDLRLDQGPHGAILWPSSTDKMGRESLVPVAAPVREVLDRVLVERPGIGRAPVFPAPHNASTPISVDVASGWLLRAEQVACVPKQDGSLWHAFRRGWATARKHQPAIDVASAGGWANTGTLQECYQHPDSSTMYQVVSQPNEIRSVR